MNKFSSVCEEKLEALAIKLQRLDTTMQLLEAKVYMNKSLFSPFSKHTL